MAKARRRCDRACDTSPFSLEKAAMIVLMIFVLALGVERFSPVARALFSVTRANPHAQIRTLFRIR